MSLPRSTFVAALCALLALTSCATTQRADPVRLATGTWTGSITTPGNNEPTYITYEVEYKGDTLAITMVVSETDRFALQDIRVADSNLTFSFTPGPKVMCDLNLKQSAYIGRCTDEEGNIVPLTMVPPEKE